MITILSQQIKQINSIEHKKNQWHEYFYSRDDK